MKQPFWNKTLSLLLILGSSKARNRFLYLLNVFSYFVNLWFQFNVFIAHSTITFMSSPCADASNARLTCGLASIRTWRKCSCDSKRSINLYRCKRSVVSLGNSFVLILIRSLIDCVRSKNIHLCGSLHKSSWVLWKLEMFSGYTCRANCTIWVLCLEFLTIYFLFKETTRVDVPWWNKFFH